jgi:LCP family protein required for cell wall assembly
MRTTLKRGMGRGAALNGDVRAVLPPTAVSPVTLYRQPPPPRRSRWRLAGSVLGWAFTILLMLAGGAAGGLYLYGHEAVAEIQAKTPEVKIAQKRLAVPSAGKPATALVLGYDRRYTGVDAGPSSRSDTIMLVRANPQNKTISMLSFPRDLVVDIHCPRRAPHRNRINQAFTECGPIGTVETVKAATGLPINYLITVNFRGFIKVVDHLGGIWLDVDRRYFNNSGLYSAINLQPGYQLLNGYQALAYVRYRHTDSDIYRTARQQAFVQAFKDQVKSAFKPTKLLGLVKDITHNVEVGQGGGGSPDLKTVLSYAFFAYGLPPGHFFQTKLDGDSLEEDSQFNLFASQETMQRVVQQFANPDVESPEKATAVALGVKLKSKAPAPRDTSVTVLNGNGVSGAAAETSYLLGQRGYYVVTAPNGKADAPTYDYFETEIHYDARQRGAKAAAAKLSNLFGSAKIVKRGPRIANLAGDAMLTVIVGKTFHGTLAAAPVDQTPKRQKANVVKASAATLQLLRDRAKKVPFPLMVPTVIERSSWVDRERPVRMYRIDSDRKHKTVRLVFKTGSGVNEYWGVQMTDWSDAPVLSERNVTRRIKGRRYELHYSGPKLHMVVLRTPKATYWVVNTLLDKLSNETMLAIAKGLKPLASLR